MNLVLCNGKPRVQALVEERFLRSLAAPEVAELEAHLASCVACSERDRRLHLAERVLAHGPGGVEEPSTAELERIALKLGLGGDEERPHSSLLAWFRPRIPAAAVLMGAAAALAAVVVLLPAPPAEERLVARGGERPLSFAVYGIERDGRVELLSGDRPLAPEAHLKLRASGPGVHGLLDVGLVLVSGDGKVERFDLAPPEPPIVEDPVSIPGAIPLASLTPGRYWVYALGLGGMVRAEELDLAVEGRPSPEEVARRLGAKALGVDRFVLEVGGPAP